MHNSSYQIVLSTTKRPKNQFNGELAMRSIELFCNTEAFSMDAVRDATKI